jgi:hypothetical protein
MRTLLAKLGGSTAPLIHDANFCIGVNFVSRSHHVQCLGRESTGLNHCIVDYLIGCSFFLEKINHQLIVESLEMDNLLFITMALCQK